MRLWSQLHSWVRAMLRRSRMEREMDAELRFHIEAFAEDLVRSGVSREEALRRARMEFGGIEGTKEECREARGVNAIESLIQDLRFGLRMLRNSPGFTATAILTLALGIGANTAIFSVVDAILLRPLPYPEPGRLVRIWESSSRRDSPRNVVNPFNFMDWRGAIAGVRVDGGDFGIDDESQRAQRALCCTGNASLSGILFCSADGTFAGSNIQRG